MILDLMGGPYTSPAWCVFPRSRIEVIPPVVLGGRGGGEELREEGEILALPAHRFELHLKSVACES